MVTTLEVQGLSRRFGEVVAVDDVSFTVEPGRMTGFVGGNGAGKTTTMRMIMGLLAPDRGEVRWNGRPVTAADRRRVGYMPEERGLYPKQEVADQLVYLGELAGMPRASARDAVHAYLERFDLADRATDKVEKLSLGNQQRVQIIASLMIDPAALILDEPFSGLDPDAVDAMAGMLRERVADGIPVLFSSHQLDLVERLCDRVVILRAGRVVAEGAVDDLRRRGTEHTRLVTAGDLGWLRGIPGIQVVDLDGHEALLDVADEASGQALLAEALRRGPVREFAPVVPRLSEIYREVAS